MDDLRRAEVSGCIITAQFDGNIAANRQRACVWLQSDESFHSNQICFS